MIILPENSNTGQNRDKRVFARLKRVKQWNVGNKKKKPASEVEKPKEPELSPTARAARIDKLKRGRQNRAKVGKIKQQLIKPRDLNNALRIQSDLDQGKNPPSLKIDKGKDIVHALKRGGHIQGFRGKPWNFGFNKDALPSGVIAPMKVDNLGRPHRNFEKLETQDEARHKNIPNLENVRHGDKKRAEAREWPDKDPRSPKRINTKLEVHLDNVRKLSHQVLDGEKEQTDLDEGVRKLRNSLLEYKHPKLESELPTDGDPNKLLEFVRGIDPRRGINHMSIRRAKKQMGLQPGLIRRADGVEQHVLHCYAPPRKARDMSQEGFVEHTITRADGTEARHWYKDPEYTMEGVQRETDWNYSDFDNREVLDITSTDDIEGLETGMNTSMIVTYKGFHGLSKAFIKNDDIEASMAEYATSNFFHSTLAGKVGFSMPKSNLVHPSKLPRNVNAALWKPPASVLFNEFLSGALPICNASNNPELIKKTKLEDIIDAMVFNQLIGNADFHDANCMIGPEGEVYVIDTGQSLTRRANINKSFSQNVSGVGVLENYLEGVGIEGNGREWIDKNTDLFQASFNKFKSIGIDEIKRGIKEHCKISDKNAPDSEILRNIELNYGYLDVNLNGTDIDREYFAQELAGASGDIWPTYEEMGILPAEEIEYARNYQEPEDFEDDENLPGWMDDFKEPEEEEVEPDIPEPTMADLLQENMERRKQGLELYSGLDAIREAWHERMQIDVPEGEEVSEMDAARVPIKDRLAQFEPVDNIYELKPRKTEPTKPPEEWLTKPKMADGKLVREPFQLQGAQKPEGRLPVKERARQNLAGFRSIEDSAIHWSPRNSTEKYTSIIKEHLNSNESGDWADGYDKIFFANRYANNISTNGLKKGMSDASFNMRVEINGAEEDIKRAVAGTKDEIFAVFDDDGSVIDWERGENSHVDVTGLLHKIKGKICTHNHPSGSSFSCPDIQAMIYGGAREERITSDKYTYIIRAPDGGWKGITPQMIGDEHKEVQATMMPDLWDSIENGDLTPEQANHVLSHSVMTHLANRFGFFYKKIRNDDRCWTPEKKQYTAEDIFYENIVLHADRLAVVNMTEFDSETEYRATRNQLEAEKQTEYYIAEENAFDIIPEEHRKFVEAEISRYNNFEEHEFKEASESVMANGEYIHKALDGWFNLPFSDPNKFVDLENAITSTFGLPVENSRTGQDIKNGASSRELLQYYAVTQAYLRKRFPDGKVLLFRGVNYEIAEKIREAGYGILDTVETECYNTSSWSSSFDLATEFAEDGEGVVLSVVVPIEQIFCHFKLSRTEYPAEKEYILMNTGGGPLKTRIEYDIEDEAYFDEYGDPYGDFEEEPDKDKYYDGDEDDW